MEKVSESKIFYYLFVFFTLFCIFIFFLPQEELLKFQANLKRQLELIRMNTRPPPAPSASTQSQMPFNRQNSNTSNAANEDGWVLVPSQNESDAWIVDWSLAPGLQPNLNCNIYNNQIWTEWTFEALSWVLLYWTYTHCFQRSKVNEKNWRLCVIKLLWQNHLWFHWLCC